MMLRPAIRYPDWCESSQERISMHDIIGVPWCREEDYNTFRGLFKDPNRLPLTWTEFSKATQEAERHYQDIGAIVERVDINLDAFAKWLASEGNRIDSDAHFRFTNRMAKQRHIS
jgi:hypothetical protein